MNARDRAALYNECTMCDSGEWPYDANSCPVCGADLEEYELTNLCKEVPTPLAKKLYDELLNNEARPMYSSHTDNEELKAIHREQLALMLKAYKDTNKLHENYYKEYGHE